MDRNIYGKMKNDRLIIAPKIYTRDGEVGYQDRSLYESLGYKKVVYSHAPDNRDGYELYSYWQEENDYIEQKWSYHRIEEDYSAELLCSIRDFNYSLDYIVDNLHDLKDKKIGEYQRKLEESELLAIVWRQRDLLEESDTLLHLLHRCNLDLKIFFEELSITSDIEKMGYTIYSDYVAYNDGEGKKQWYPFTYIKCGLSHIYALYTFSTLECKTAYDMAYIYAFTLFDDLLLKFARYICTLEKNWLASNTTLTFKDVVNCSSLEDIYQMLIEQKVSELSWGSYLDKLEFFNKHGIRTDNIDPVLFKDTIFFISQKRNAIVHNGGMWNESICNLLKSNKHIDSVEPNQPVERTIESIEEECGENLRRAANGLYDLLCTKFNLIHRYKDVNSDICK